VADRRLHPATLFTRTIRRLPEYALGLPALGRLGSSAEGLTLLLLGALGIAIAAAAALLTWLRFRYGVGDNELVIESGVLFRQRRIIPFARIQDVDIERNLLARLTGTAAVRIETGGSGKDEGRLDAVGLAEAERLRTILRLARASGVPSTSGAPAEAEEVPLFAMTPGRVLLAGVLGFSLLSIAFLAAGFQYLDPLFRNGWLEPDRLEEIAGRYQGSARWAASLVVAMFLILLALLIGIVRTAARDWGFRLTRVPAGLRRRRGLFTLSEVMIPIRRIQLALLRSSFIARQLGWQALEFQTLGADVRKSGHQVAAPLARIAELRPILAEAGLDRLPDEGSYTRVSVRHILRQSLRWTALAAMPLAANILFYPQLAWAILLLPLPVALAALQWRHHRYHLDGGMLHIRAGILTRRLFILPLANIQSVELRRGWLQRRLGLATLDIDTAGAAFHHPRISNLPHEKAGLLFASLLAVEPRRSGREGFPPAAAWL
jgi:putative membrane protein